MQRYETLKFPWRGKKNASALGVLELRQFLEFGLAGAGQHDAAAGELQRRIRHHDQAVAHAEKAANREHGEGGRAVPG